MEKMDEGGGKRKGEREKEGEGGGEVMILRNVGQPERLILLKSNRLLSFLG